MAQVKGLGCLAAIDVVLGRSGRCTADDQQAVIEVKVTVLVGGQIFESKDAIAQRANMAAAIAVDGVTGEEDIPKLGEDYRGVVAIPCCHRPTEPLGAVAPLAEP